METVGRSLAINKDSHPVNSQDSVRKRITLKRDWNIRQEIKKVIIRMQSISHLVLESSQK